MSDAKADPEIVLKWFFCFRQSFPRPPGSWVTCGPYESWPQAEKERERSKKAWDAEVGNVFSAATKDEAEARCKSGLTG